MLLPKKKVQKCKISHLQCLKLAVAKAEGGWGGAHLRGRKEVHLGPRHNSEEAKMAPSVKMRT